MKTIYFEFPEYKFEVQLRDTETAKAILKILPIEAAVKKWGDEFYFEAPLKQKLELEDNAKEVINLGEIVYWVEGGCIAIGFGPTPISQGNEIRLAARTNVWGDAKLDTDALKKIQDSDIIKVS